MPARLIVTGSGHSGTAWTAWALSALGVPATHEGVFTFDGPRPWPARLRADVSLAAMPYLGDPDIPPATIIVRDPLEVLNSFYRLRVFADRCPCHQPGAHLGAPFMHFAGRYVDLLEEPNEVARAIRYITDWHALGAAHAATIVRLEDLTGGDFVGWARDFADVAEGDTLELLPNMPTNVNAHGPSGPARHWITWEELAGHQHGETLRTYAERLRYV